MTLSADKQSIALHSSVRFLVIDSCSWRTDVKPRGTLGSHKQTRFNSARRLAESSTRQGPAASNSAKLTRFTRTVPYLPAAPSYLPVRSVGHYCTSAAIQDLRDPPPSSLVTILLQQQTTVLEEQYWWLILKRENSLRRYPIQRVEPTRCGP